MAARPPRAVREVEPFLYQPDKEESEQRLLEATNKKIARIMRAPTCIFLNEIQGENHECLCGGCQKTCGSKFDWCCQSLWAFENDLTPIGSFFKEVLEEKFFPSGNPNRCITKTDVFRQEFLNLPVINSYAFGLHTKQNQLNKATSSYEVEEFSNRELRFHCYSLMSYRLFPKLGKGVRMEFPLCIINAIRELCPSIRITHTPVFYRTREGSSTHSQTLNSRKNLFS